MRYFWTSEYNSGVFYYWEVEDEKSLQKKAAKLYCGKAYDFGETCKKSYDSGRKFLGVRDENQN